MPQAQLPSVRPRTPQGNILPKEEDCGRKKAEVISFSKHQEAPRDTGRVIKDADHSRGFKAVSQYLQTVDLRHPSPEPVTGIDLYA